MRKVLIVTHGTLAQGFASSVNVLLGRDDIQYINAYVGEDNNDYTPKIIEFLESLKNDDEGVIFTDIYGGSVNQKVINVVSKLEKPAFVITQVNLPIILEVLLAVGDLSSDRIDEFISSSPVQLISIEKMMNGTVNESESEFFD